MMFTFPIFRVRTFLVTIFVCSVSCGFAVVVGGNFMRSGVVLD
jgi:hypothetical protein